MNGVFQKIADYQEDCRQRAGHLSKNLVLPSLEKLFVFSLAELQQLNQEMVLQVSRENEAFHWLPFTEKYEWHRQYAAINVILKFLTAPGQQIPADQWLIRGPMVGVWLTANCKGEISLSNLQRVWAGLDALDKIGAAPEPPAITRQPDSVTLSEEEILHEGKVAIFIVAVAATGGVTGYQWFRREPGQKEFEPIPGAINPKYVFSPERWNSRCEYCCDVTNDAGTTRSDAATFRFVI